MIRNVVDLIPVLLLAMVFLVGSINVPSHSICDVGQRWERDITKFCALRINMFDRSNNNELCSKLHERRMSSVLYMCFNYLSK